MSRSQRKSARPSPRLSPKLAGHNIALENPAALAHAYLDFFATG